MEFLYGKPLQLKHNIKLKFYVDGIYPAGQMGYTEPYYKILFDQASLLIPDSLARVLFEEKIEQSKCNTNCDKHSKSNLKKMNKDDLISLASQIDSSSDLTKLRKDQLIKIIEGK